MKYEAPARDFDASHAYAPSKLALIRLTFDLAAELSPARITANALHPAMLMDATMAEKAGARPTTIDDGADALMPLAVSPALAGRIGLNFDSLEPARANAHRYDTEARARLRAPGRESTVLG